MMNSTRSRGAARTTSLTALGLACALAFTGCGKIVETAFEEGLEEAVEADTGEDVEIDFDSDGNISISGDDGEFNLSVDEEDGAVLSGSDENGDEFEYVTGEGLSDDWPSDIPSPPGDIVGSTIFNDNGTLNVSAIAEVNDPIGTHEAYLAQLLSNGFEIGSESSFSSDGIESKFVEVTSSGWMGAVNASEDADGSGTGALIITFQQVTS